MLGGEVSFSRPPICEVAYSFQFEPIELMHMGYLGLLWGEEFKSGYPKVEQDDPLQHEIERFGAAASTMPKTLKFFTKLPVPRIRMISDDSCSLLQIQNDRFVFNWRNHSTIADVEYPRFDSLKETFSREFAVFSNFLGRNSLGELNINQVEITNVNHIPANGMSFSEIFAGLECGVDISSDLKSESISFRTQHVIHLDNKPIGRLYTVIEKAYLSSDSTEIFKLTFTARSNLKDATIVGALDILTLLRNKINQSFVCLTNGNMHEIWGKEDI
jgi:uncharacterized protein (TIGR04255 family)